jgi:phosphotransferase system HPr-like phosphotransfer protein
MEERYTTFRQKVELKYGLNLRDGLVLACACEDYIEQCQDSRKIFVSNVSSKNPKFEVNAQDLTELIRLKAEKGDLLEFRIGGTDILAKTFREELRKGLTEEDYLFNWWMEE